MTNYSIKMKEDLYNIHNEANEIVKSLYTLTDAKEWVQYLLLKEDNPATTVPSTKEFLTEEGFVMRPLK